MKYLNPVGSALILFALLPCNAQAQKVQATDDATVSKVDAYYHLMQATLAARKGELRKVEKELDRAAKFDSDSAALHAEGAGLFIALGQRDQAERWARKAYSLDPNEPTALRILGDLAYSRALSGGGSPDAVEEAIDYFSRLTKLEDEIVEPEIYEALFQLERQRGNVQAAIERYSEFADRRPGDLLVHRQLVALLSRVGRNEDAFDRMLAFNRRYGEIQAFTSLWASIVETPLQWSELANLLVERAPEEPAGSLDSLIVECLLRGARYREAALRLESMPTDEDFNRDRQLAAAYAAGGRLADAAMLYRSLANENPDDAEIWERLGQTLYRQRDLSAAIDAWEQALETLEGVSEAENSRDLLRWRMAMAALDQALPTKARTYLNQLEQSADRDLLALRFRIALAEEDWDDAKQTLLTLEPLEVPGRFSLMQAELALNLDETKKASSFFNKALKELGKAVIPRVADLWRTHDYSDRAESLLVQWTKDEPENMDAHFALGRFLEREKRIVEAERVLDRALSLDPNNPELQNYLGYALADNNRNLPKALELIQKALQQDPWNGAYLDSLGWVYFKMGDLERAREPLEQAVREYPYDSVVVDHLADWHAAKGNDATALLLWKQALDLAPEEEKAPLIKKIETKESALSSAEDAPEQKSAADKS